MSPYRLTTNHEAKCVLSTAVVDCSIANPTSAICVESFGGSEANSPGKTTETYSGTSVYQPVIITDRLQDSTGGWESTATKSTVSATSTVETKTTDSASNTGLGGSRTPTLIPTSASAAAANFTNGAKLLEIGLGRTSWCTAMLVAGSLYLFL